MNKTFLCILSFFYTVNLAAMYGTASDRMQTRYLQAQAQFARQQREQQATRDRMNQLAREHAKAAAQAQTQKKK